MQARGGAGGGEKAHTPHRRWVQAAQPDRGAPSAVPCPSLYLTSPHPLPSEQTAAVTPQVNGVVLLSKQLKENK